MKIAEALAERADISKRLQQLKERAEQVARIQEGDIPDEDPVKLIAESERLLERLLELIARINRTNSTTPFDATKTITDAIAARDVEALRRRFYTDLAASAAARQDRYTRTEVRYVAAVDVRDLRSKADAAARKYRELDTRLQQLNWLTDLD